MSLKRPIIIRALSRPLTIFGMHSLMTIFNLCLSAGVGVLSELIFGVILFSILQFVIAILTRRDHYFAEVYIAKLKVGKTKNLNPRRKGNYYAV